jgi:hypothetical protein
MSPRFQIVLKFAKRVGLSLAALATAATLPLAFPGPMFGYGVDYADLSVYSDAPLPAAEVRSWLGEVQALLEASPLRYEGEPTRIYIAGSTWRWRSLWLVHRGGQVGGFAVPLLSTRHMFLSGADFSTLELIAPNGRRMPPPRTLTYYAAHELAHVLTARQFGAVRSYTIPQWMKEGIADYVALPSESAAGLYSRIGERDPDLSMINEHGVYAPFRLLVTYFLEDAGWTLDRLVASDLSLDAARAIAFGALRQ